MFLFLYNYTQREKHTVMYERMTTPAINVVNGVALSSAKNYNYDIMSLPILLAICILV